MESHVSFGALVFTQFDPPSLESKHYDPIGLAPGCRKNLPSED